MGTENIGFQTALFGFKKQDVLVCIDKLSAESLEQQKQAELQFRNQVSEFALQIAGKVVKTSLADDKAQKQLVNTLLDEIESNN